MQTNTQETRSIEDIIKMIDIGKAIGLRLGYA